MKDHLNNDLPVASAVTGGLEKVFLRGWHLEGQRRGNRFQRDGGRTRDESPGVFVGARMVGLAQKGGRDEEGDSGECGFASKAMGRQEDITSAGSRCPVTVPLSSRHPRCLPHHTERA